MAIFGAAWGWPGQSAASEPTAPDRALAQTLFEDGVRLMGSATYDEACPKLAESHRLDPAGGTIYNLAICYEKAGKLASAYLSYDEALAAATRDENKERAHVARGRLEMLRPRVAKVVLRVDEQARRLEGLDVRLDGSTVRREGFGVPIPADRGTHLVEATAPGHLTFRRSIVISEDGRVVEVPIPSLAVAFSSSGPSSPAPIAARAPERLDAPGTSRRTVALLFGGVSLASLATGTVFAILAAGRHAESNRECSLGPNRCTEAGVAAENAADGLAWGANIGIAAGLVSGFVGGYLLFTSSSQRGPAAAPHTTATVAIAPFAAGAPGASFVGHFE